jgi:hypothetical protein
MLLGHVTLDLSIKENDKPGCKPLFMGRKVRISCLKSNEILKSGPLVKRLAAHISCILVMEQLRTFKIQSKFEIGPTNLKDLKAQAQPSPTVEPNAINARFRFRIVLSRSRSLYSSCAYMHRRSICEEASQR